MNKHKILSFLFIYVVFVEAQTDSQIQQAKEIAKRANQKIKDQKKLIKQLKSKGLN